MLIVFAVLSPISTDISSQCRHRSHGMFAVSPLGQCETLTDTRTYTCERPIVLCAIKIIQRDHDIMCVCNSGIRQIVREDNPYEA